MPLPAGHPPFSSFSSFQGVRAAKPLFYWLECRFVIFAIFVKNPPFCHSGGTKARFTKSTVFGTPTNPVLPFLDFSVLPRKNLKLTKDFRPLSNPLKPWKRQRKHQNNQGNSLLKFYQGISRRTKRGIHKRGIHEKAKFPLF